MAAAVACAGLYAGIVILTGKEYGLAACAMGAAVGFAVVMGNPRVGQGWVRALSVLLTLASLLLSSYLLLWLYDGQGFDPVPISLSEAASTMRSLPAEDPLELVFWGLALLTAFGVTRSDGPDDHDQALADDPRSDEGSPPIANLEPALRDSTDHRSGPSSSPRQPEPGYGPLAYLEPPLEDLPTHAVPRPVPARLSARPVDRFVWSGVWVVCGAFLLTLGAVQAVGPGMPPYALPVVVAIAMGCLTAAALGLRLGLVADEHGITLCRPITTSRTSWSDLQDVVLEPRSTDIDVGLHRLVLVTHEGHRVPAGFMGRAREGAPLPELRRSLLAMHQWYRATAPAAPDTAPGVTPVDTGSPGRRRSTEPTDRVSLAALVLSVLGVVVAAAPLALWGLARGGPGPRRGHGLAVAALCVSGLWVVAASALLVGTGLTGVPSAPDPNAPLAHAHEAFWDDLSPESCVRVPDDVDWQQAIVVDCRLPHHEEVMASSTLDAPEVWTGDEAIDAATDEACQTAFEDYVGVAPEDSQLDYYAITADRNGWNNGEHTLICMVFDPSRHELPAPLRDSGR